jgi:hypothetical protein
MLAAGTCEPLVDAVQEGQLQPGLQGRLVELAARAMALPPGGAEAVVGDRLRGGSLRDLAELAYARCFKAGRLSHELAVCAADQQRGQGSDSGGGAGGGPGPSLLQAAAELTADPQLQAGKGSNVPAHLLAALLKLQATFASDAGAAAAGSEGQLLPPEHLARLLCAMGGPGGLPLLCQLAADVAAAGSGSQPAAATGCSNGGCVNGCCGGRCSTSFGQFAWRELNDECLGPQRLGKQL